MQAPESNKKCGDPRCRCCHLLSEERNLKINGKPFTPVDCGSCRSSNLIYSIKCKKCNLHYIGETAQALSLRITGHRTAINRTKNGAKTTATTTEQRTTSETGRTTSRRTQKLQSWRQGIGGQASKERAKKTTSF